MSIDDDIASKILEMKSRGWSQQKIALGLGISRSTVQRHWGKPKLTLASLFQVSSCAACGVSYPKPLFLGAWKAPCCGSAVERIRDHEMSQDDTDTEQLK